MGLWGGLHLRRLDNSAAAEKQAKTVLVPKNAVIRIQGWVARTISTSGLRVAPSKKAHPATSPYLWLQHRSVQPGSK